MSKELEQYRLLEGRLWMTRWKHEGEESADEDAILDEMENTWMKLTEDERNLLRLEGPRCWPTDSSSLPALNATAPTPWAYEGFQSPAETILSSDAA